MKKVKLTREICLRCLKGTFPFGSSLITKFARNWEKGSVRCPAYYFASVSVDYLPDDCPYELEQIMENQKC